MFPPSRIVYLTEETVETLYPLGELDRIVGISGYVVRPPQAFSDGPRLFRATLHSGEGAWSRSEVHASGGLGTGDRGTWRKSRSRRAPKSRWARRSSQAVRTSSPAPIGGRVHADLVWSKLRTLVESARLAWTSLRTN